MNPVNDTGVFSLRKAEGGTLKMLFTGDLAATEVTTARYARRDFDAMLGAIRPAIRSADLRVVDVELPLVDKEIPTAKLLGEPGMRAPRELLDGLVYLGVDFANLANNHVTDQGPEGVRSTLGLLRNAGIRTFGAGMDEAEAALPLLIERYGFRILLLGLVTDEENIAGPSKPGANLFTPERLIESVRRWRPEADVLIVNVHAGSEHLPLPDPYRLEAFRAAAEAGADVVIGHHPHVPQGCEVRDGRFITYSLGNFHFYLQDFRGVAPMAALSYAVELELDRKGVVGGRFIPHRTTDEEENLLPLDGADRLAFLRYLREISALLDDDAKRDRLYRAGCWRLWGLTYMPWVIERIKKSAPEEAIRFMAGWAGNMVEAPHRDIARNVFQVYKSGVNPRDLQELDRLRQRPC